MESEQPRPRAQPSPDNARKRVRKRKCWICLDEVQATYEDPGVLGGLRGKGPKRRYIDEDGREMINPCKCNGSIKWVHEDCLKHWLNEGHYECSRCKYRYQFTRLTWAQRLRSPLLTLAITIGILLTTVFLLGFVADPILSLWLDPVGAIKDSVVSSGGPPLDDEDPEGWFEHFLKGIFSLGLLGFVKTFLTLSPWQWWNLRSSGIVGGGGGRRVGTGRDRMENINLTLVVLGVITFLWTVWKMTRKWTERTLDRASQRILNVQEEDKADSESEDEDEDVPAGGGN
ncbi:hypothetical protein F4780DRAFT_758464 [Xylariomycetidae sp. FL0641]|nr:hypothetical protein F4780DRAFT_758464 [Xylariomycetidae sp. FL0641]